jgi:hypothetical protein
MTKQQELTKRLFRLFPAANLKNILDTKDNFEQILNNAAQTKSLDEAKDYAINNFDFAKLDIMLFQLENGARMRQTDLPVFPFSVITKNLAGFNRFFGFPEVSFDVILASPEARESLGFLCPVQIVLRQKAVEVRVIKLEKKISSYFPEERYARHIGGHHVDYADQIKAIFLGCGFVQCDINKGVKHAWEADLIDAKKVQHRDGSSVVTRLMDEKQLLKKHNYEKYLETVAGPLKSTYFQYMKSDKEWPDNLTIDASQGTLSFTKFAHHQNQLDHVVTTIISQN